MHRATYIFFSILLFSGCTIPSADFSKDAEYTHIVGQCYELKQPAFVFEGRCADLTGFNNNSELCNSIQAQGVGGFPTSWADYRKDQAFIDRQLFDRLIFEKQRSMLFPLEAGSKIYISKLVHHGWGTDGRYWVVRGKTLINGSDIEVELPSFSYVHSKPYWVDGRAQVFPGINPSFLVQCNESP
ncbi:hypothetical protein Misp06_04404 [Microbulbifer sp. NBRC 101763]|uniref:hypothetical protein n=1 Tax=Microbulbifer sp. NBRC 101763 TaxID=1113820 RepID=UPI0030B799D8